jgi:hypothetical protein
MALSLCKNFGFELREQKRVKQDRYDAEIVVKFIVYDNSTCY